MIRRNSALVLGVCVICVSAFGEPTISLSTADGTGLSDREMELDVVHLPSARSLQEANSGRVDGEFGRISTVGEDYPNLVMVPEPHAGLVLAIDQQLSLLKTSGRYAELQEQAFGFVP